MKEIEEARNAVGKISHSAMRGDSDAIAALRDIALRAIGILENLTDTPDGHPDIPEALQSGVSAAHKLAKDSQSWPIRWDAIAEKRNKTLSRTEGLKIGANLGVKLSGKRRFDYDQQTGFAYDLFLEIEAIRKSPAKHTHPADLIPQLNQEGVLTESQAKRSAENLAALLPSLSKNSLEDWTKAALEICRDHCENEWENFPWPDCVYGKAGKDTDGNGTLRTTESAIRGKISEGFKALI